MPYEMAEELNVTIKNEVGAMGGVLKAMADAGVAVRAFCGYGMGDGGSVYLVPSDAKKAKVALKKAGYGAPKSQNVVVATVANKVGAGAALTAKVAKAGVNLEYAYASGTGKGQGVVVLGAGKASASLLKKLK